MTLKAAQRKAEQRARCKCEPYYVVLDPSDPDCTPGAPYAVASEYDLEGYYAGAKVVWSTDEKETKNAV